MASERRDQVYRYIDSKGEVTLGELMALFPDRSAMTLRRDLIHLENGGLIKRTRGGAVALQRLAMAEGLYSKRERMQPAAKMAIAEKALEAIENAQSLYLDAGSTVMFLTKILPEQYRSIITSGANIALELAARTHVPITLLGGTLGENTLSVSGSFAMDMIERLNIDVAVMSTSGFTLENGFMSGSISEHELKRKVIAKANRTIMLMDVSKIGQRLPFTFAHFDDIDDLICDALPNEPVMKALAERGVRLLVAE